MPILSWKMERYLSFPFHEYLLLQKNNQRKYPPLFPRVHYHISSMCSFVFYSLPCLPSPVNVHLPEFTVCLSLGSFKSNSGTSLTSPSPCFSQVWSWQELWAVGHVWHRILQPVMLLSNRRSISWSHHCVIVSLHHSFTKNPLCDKNCPRHWGYLSGLIRQGLSPTECTVWMGDQTVSN